MSGSGMKGAAFSLTLHVALLAAAFFFSAKTKGDPVVSSADPLLALLADPDADPTKDAGLVGEQRGIAEGTLDGDTLEPIPLAEIGEDLLRQSEEALNTPLPEPEPALVPESAPVPAPQPVSKPPVTKPDPVVKQNVLVKPQKPAEKPKPSATGGDKKSFKEWQEEQKRKQNSGGGKKTQPKKPGGGTGVKPVKAPKIDTSSITGNGGGNGTKRFGVQGGTGGNGGDGGAAVASARQTYVAELEKKLAAHLDGVLTQTPLKLDGAVVVKVSLVVDSRGNVRLLDVQDSSDPQVRDRVSKAVARLGKFRVPPEGKAFEILIPRVELRPQL